MASVDAMQSDAVAASALLEMVYKSFGANKSAIKNIGDAVLQARDSAKELSTQKVQLADKALIDLRQSMRSLPEAVSAVFTAVLDVLSALLIPTIPDIGSIISAITTSIAFQKGVKNLVNKHNEHKYEYYLARSATSMAGALTLK